MFAIYNEQGRIFRNTLEEMYRIPLIRPMQAAGRVRQKDGEPQEAFRDYQTNEAINAYRQVISAKSDQPIHHVYQIMKRPVITAFEGSSLGECYALLKSHNIKQLPVLSKDNQPMGLFTLDRLASRLLENGETLAEWKSTPVSDLLTLPLITADPLADIHRVAKVMGDRQLNCVPITNEADMFVGIVTRTDIVLAVANNPGMTIWA
ncbi:MAG TPA: CBS domain-containing protein [Desulforhopalus sp.]|nr:CBS domain-containing protein [Desulforhopalus sp.]